MQVTCPLDHVNDAGDYLAGCGHVFDAGVDEEGYVDCPQCGLWFTPPVDEREIALIDAAIAWLTDDRSPSTRDLLSLEGLKVADWVDTREERRGIVREIVIGYGSLDDMRAFLSTHGLDEVDD